MDKAKIFISHANPTDNYFAFWLSNKLEILGYDTWVDVQKVKPGGYFNQLYEHALRNESAIFLPILTSSYILKANTNDSGVANEISIARSLGKEIKEYNFIIPIVLGKNITHGEFPVGIIDRDAISFSSNWGEGLGKLIKHVKELKIIHRPKTDGTLNRWIEFLETDTKPIIKEERYFTNWLQVNLPPTMYVHKCQATTLPKQFPFPYISESYYIIGFFAAAILESFSIKILNSWTFTNVDFLNHKIDIHEFVIKDARKKLVKLLNESIEIYATSLHIRKYVMSNNNTCFFFPATAENIKQISLKHIGKNRRGVVGITKTHHWHFGLSFHAITHPIVGFKVNYHVIFSNRNDEKVLGKKEQQSLRKASTTDWYNEKWYETMVAFIHHFSKQSANGQIEIQSGGIEPIKIKTIPINFESNVGYNEPLKSENEN